MTRGRRPWILAALLGAVAPACAHSRPTPTRKFCRLLDREVERGHTPGLSTAIVDREGALLLRGSGVADPFRARPASPESVYMWFSITKLFTATAVLQLADAGKIELDGAFSSYVAKPAPENPWPTPLRVRHLLNHSSGLPEAPVFGYARPHGRARPELASFLAQLLGPRPRLEHEPGTRERYSNIAYLLLGRLVEVVSGQPYESYVREHILARLGMEDSDFVWRPDMIEQAAIGHVRLHTLYHRLFEQVADPSLFGPEVGRHVTSRLYIVDGAPYGGLAGPAEDLARFAAAFLRGGRPILSARAVGWMLAPQPRSDGRPLSHTLGWHAGRLGEVRYYNHMGRGGGYRPEIRIYPDLGQAIVVLANETRYDPKRLSRRLPLPDLGETACLPAKGPQDGAAARR